MKYAVIIPWGASDLPSEDLGGRTPLQAARMPWLREIARSGRVGRMASLRQGYQPSDAALLMNLFGCDVRRSPADQGVADALAMEVSLAPGEWAFRLDLVTVSPGGKESRLIDDSPSGLGDAEAHALFAALLGFWQAREPGLARGLEVYALSRGRAVLVDRAGRDFSLVETTIPVLALDESWRAAMPRGGTDREASMLRRLVELSAEFLESHEVNVARADQGLSPANLAWIWGGGTTPGPALFEEMFGVRAAMLARHHTAVGVASLLGMTTLTRRDTRDFRGSVVALEAALAEHDVVFWHLDLAGHLDATTPEAKVQALEAIDAEVVGPVLYLMRGIGSAEANPDAHGWRIMVAPGATVQVSSGRPTLDPTPFAIAGDWVRSVVERDMTEHEANASDLLVDPGHDLMEYFLHGGLARARPARGARHG